MYAPQPQPQPQPQPPSVTPTVAGALRRYVAAVCDAGKLDADTARALDAYVSAAAAEDTRAAERESGTITAWMRAVHARVAASRGTAVLHARAIDSDVMAMSTMRTSTRKYTRLRPLPALLPAFSASALAAWGVVDTATTPAPVWRVVGIVEALQRACVCGTTSAELRASPSASVATELLGRAALALARVILKLRRGVTGAPSSVAAVVAMPVAEPFTPGSAPRHAIVTTAVAVLSGRERFTSPRAGADGIADSYGLVVRDIYDKLGPVYTRAGPAGSHAVAGEGHGDERSGANDSDSDTDADSDRGGSDDDDDDDEAVAADAARGADAAVRKCTTPLHLLFVSMYKCSVRNFRVQSSASIVRSEGHRALVRSVLQYVLAGAVPLVPLVLRTDELIEIVDTAAHATPSQLAAAATASLHAVVHAAYQAVALTCIAAEGPLYVAHYNACTGHKPHGIDSLGLRLHTLHAALALATTYLSWTGSSGCAGLIPVALSGRTVNANKISATIISHAFGRDALRAASSSQAPTPTTAAGQAARSITDAVISGKVTWCTETLVAAVVIKDMIAAPIAVGGTFMGTLTTMFARAGVKPSCDPRLVAAAAAIDPRYSDHARLGFLCRFFGVRGASVRRCELVRHEHVTRRVARNYFTGILFSLARTLPAHDAATIYGFFEAARQRTAVVVHPVPVAFTVAVATALAEKEKTRADMVPRVTVVVRNGVVHGASNLSGCGCRCAPGPTPRLAAQSRRQPRLPGNHGLMSLDVDGATPYGTRPWSLASLDIIDADRLRAAGTPRLPGVVASSPQDFTVSVTVGGGVVAVTGRALIGFCVSSGKLLSHIDSASPCDLERYIALDGGCTVTGRSGSGSDGALASTGVDIRAAVAGVITATTTAAARRVPRAVAPTMAAVRRAITAAEVCPACLGRTLTATGGSLRESEIAVRAPPAALIPRIAPLVPGAPATATVDTAKLYDDNPVPLRMTMRVCRTCTAILARSPWFADAVAGTAAVDYAVLRSFMDSTTNERGRGGASRGYRETGRHSVAAYFSGR